MFGLGRDKIFMIVVGSLLLIEIGLRYNDSQEIKNIRLDFYEFHFSLADFDRLKRFFSCFHCIFPENFEIADFSRKGSRT